MGALDHFLSRAKSVAQTTGKKASEILEATKLNLSISELQAEADTILKDIGKIIYHNYEEQMVTNEEIAKMCAAIEEKYAQVKELKDKLNSIKNLKICPKCGDANPAAGAFCQKCGSKLEEAPKPEEGYVEADLDNVQKPEE